MPEDDGLLTFIPAGILVFVGIVAALVVVVFATLIVRGVALWRRNNASPVVSTVARVVTKRSEVHGGAGETSASTAYFATFETPTGERCELGLPARDFGLIADGDSGQLAYQGTRFKGFARTSTASR